MSGTVLLITRDRVMLDTVMSALKTCRVVCVLLSLGGHDSVRAKVEGVRLLPVRIDAERYFAGGLYVSK